MLNTKDAAAYVGLAVQTLAEMRVSGDSPPFYKLGRQVFYDRAELDEWIALRRDVLTVPTESAVGIHAQFGRERH